MANKKKISDLMREGLLSEINKNSMMKFTGAETDFLIDLGMEAGRVFSFNSSLDQLNLTLLQTKYDIRLWKRVNNMKRGMESVNTRIIFTDMNHQEIDSMYDISRL